MDIDVSCYAGYRGEETPRNFQIGDRKIHVRKVISRWKTPEQRCFKIEGDDATIYILCHNELRWTLTQSGKPAETTDVPDEWKLLDVSDINGLLMVVGAPDTGKTTFIKSLRGLYEEKYPVIACIDGDPGQSSLGPPATLTLKIKNSSASSECVNETWRWFVGSVSPAGHMLQVLTGSMRLLAKARASGAKVIIFDTSGFVDEKKGGARLKLAKINALCPDRLFALQRDQELEPWLAQLRLSNRVRIEDILCIPATHRRNANIRKTNRVNNYKQYFEQAGVIHLDQAQYGVFPSPQFDDHRLVSLEDKDGFVIALGIILAEKQEMEKINIYSPIRTDDLGNVRSIVIGDMRMDPETFEHQIIEEPPAANPLKWIRNLLAMYRRSQ